MSTKAIREALQALEEHATTDCQSAAAAKRVQRKLNAARAELDAIEKAAKVWGSAPEGTLPGEVEDMLYSIAKEAP